MIFKSSNGRTYDLDFNNANVMPITAGSGHRFYLSIVAGLPIRVEGLDDGSGDNRVYAVAPFYDPVEGIIQWDNPFYDDKSLIEAFVPDDLREYCNKVVRNLVLL